MSEKKIRLNFDLNAKLQSESIETIEKLISEHWYNAASFEQLAILVKSKHLNPDRNSILGFIQALRQDQHGLTIERQHLLTLSKQKETNWHFFTRLNTDLIMLIGECLSNKDVVSLGTCCSFLNLRLSFKETGVPSLFLCQHVKKISFQHRPILSNILARCFRLQVLEFHYVLPFDDRPFLLSEQSLLEFSSIQYKYFSICDVLIKLKGCIHLKKLKIKREYDYHWQSHCLKCKTPELKWSFLKDPPWFPELETLHTHLDPSEDCYFLRHLHRHIPRLQCLMVEDGLHFSMQHFPRLTSLDLLKCQHLAILHLDLEKCTQLKTLSIVRKHAECVQNIPSSLETLITEDCFYTNEILFLKNPLLKNVKMEFSLYETYDIEWLFDHCLALLKHLQTLQISAKIKCVEQCLNVLFHSKAPNPQLKHVSFQVIPFTASKDQEKEYGNKWIEKFITLAEKQPFQVEFVIGEFRHVYSRA